MPTLDELKAAHLTWCWKCGCPSQIHCYKFGHDTAKRSAVFTALLAKAREDEARIEELDEELNSRHKAVLAERHGFEGRILEQARFLEKLILELAEERSARQALEARIEELKKEAVESNEMYIKWYGKIGDDGAPATWDDLQSQLTAERSARQALEAKLEEARIKIVRLHSDREKFDCRYAGPYMELTGNHCSFRNPCLRCQLDRARQALEEADYAIYDDPWICEDISSVPGHANCFFCGVDENDTHAPDCIVAAALSRRAARGRETGEG